MAGKGRHDHHQREALFALGEEVHDPVAFLDILEREGLGQLEGGIVAAHSHVGGNVGRSDQRVVWRQHLQQLVGLHHDLGDVHPGIFGQQGSGVRGDLQAARGEVILDPAGHLIVRQLLRFEDHAHVAGLLVEGFALVDRAPLAGDVVVGLETDHKDGRGHHRLEIDGDVFHVVHQLRLLDHHQLARDHHRELARGGHHLGGLDVRTEVDHLAEVAFLGRQCLLHDQPAEFVDEIVFLAEQQIERLELPGEDFIAEGTESGGGIGALFCHLCKGMNKIAYLRKKKRLLWRFSIRSAGKWWPAPRKRRCASS